VLNDLKSRGILDVYLFCTDSLCGMMEAPHATDTAEENPMANLPPEQTATIMGMAYLADEVNGHVRDFLRQEETSSALSRENIRYVMEMLSSMHESLNYLRDMLVDCY